jgi:hypothetical protein
MSYSIKIHYETYSTTFSNETNSEMINEEWDVDQFMNDQGESKMDGSGNLQTSPLQKSLELPDLFRNRSVINNTPISNENDEIVSGKLSPKSHVSLCKSEFSDIESPNSVNSSRRLSSNIQTSPLSLPRTSMNVPTVPLSLTQHFPTIEKKKYRKMSSVKYRPNSPDSKFNSNPKIAFEERKEKHEELNDEKFEEVRLRLLRLHFIGD